MAKTKSDPEKSNSFEAKKRSQTPAQSRAEVFRIAAGRETVEAFVVAFILALLFRAFLAEAFVIPTGSMAPTLMGAHKDVFCESCGYNFRVGASRENSPGQNVTVVAGICPNCRCVNAMDLAGDRNHATFNGDRILVNKFSYVLSEPDRWDVIVFKYPGNPKQNYIKRLVGLPEETISIRHGDVYAKPTGSDDTPVILRKSPSTLMAMSHLVHDTDYRPEKLMAAGFPSRWQPWSPGNIEPPTDSWTIQPDGGEFVASIGSADGGSSDSIRWLRYFQNIPTDTQWDAADSGTKITDAEPYASRAITDFYGYDSYIHVGNSFVYAVPPSGLGRAIKGGAGNATFNPNYESGVGPEQFGTMAIWGGQDSAGQQIGRDGVHWVGDLIVESEVEVDSQSTILALQLIEAGIQFRCDFDLNSGQAKLSIIGEEELAFDEGLSGKPNLHPAAQTDVVAGATHRVRMANCDDQIYVWIDDELVTFDSPTTYDGRSLQSDAGHRPQFSKEDPLDAAPVGIGVQGGSSKVHRLAVYRDKYYIATKNGRFGAICDYDPDQFWDLGGANDILKGMQEILQMPELWADFGGWEARREVSFELDQDQFFPMGDNSPESLDARCWAGSKERIRMPRSVNEDAWQWGDKSYVPRDLLVGRAVVVFWPHSWNSPVPFTPNVKRIKLIR